VKGSTIVRPSAITVALAQAINYTSVEATAAKPVQVTH
jgi:hypothetical protein